MTLRREDVPLRIAIVEFGTRGGLLHYSGQMADALARQGHDVSVLVPPRGELDGRLRHAHVVPCLAAGDIAAARSDGLIRRFSQRAHRAGTFLRAWVDVARWIKSHPVDVLQVGDLRLIIDAWAFVAISRMPRRPLLVDVCHNVQPFDVRRHGGAVIDRRPIVTRALSSAYRRADVIVVHGSANMRAFQERWSTRASLLAIPHGPESLFGAPPEPINGPPTVLFFGNWSSYKDLHLLLDAFALVRERIPAARLEIVGHPTKDSDAPGILDRAKGFGSAVNIKASYVEIDEVRRYFARACVVALPYRHGFQSGVISTAFSLARPVVCTQVGGLHEPVLASGGGMMVPPNDPGAFADALVAMLGDPPAALARGRRAYDWQMAAASWDIIASTLGSGYRTAIADRAALAS